MHSFCTTRSKPKTIFISWSDKQGLKASKDLKFILENIFGNAICVEVSFDMSIGQEWFTVIKNKISNSDLGIIVITYEAPNSMWQLFESGAIWAKNAILPIYVSDREANDNRSPLHNLQTLKTMTKESFIVFLKSISSHLALNISNALLSAYIEANWEKEIKPKLILDWRKKSLGTMLTIEDIKSSSFYFLAKHKNIIHSSDHIIGLNYGGIMMASIISNQMNKEVSYFWLKEENGEKKITRKAVSKELSGAQNIIICDGKYITGTGLEVLKNELENTPEKVLDDAHIFIALAYEYQKEEKEEKEAKKNYKTNIKEAINNFTSTVQAKLLFYQYTNEWNDDCDQIKEELDPYKYI